MYARLRPPHPEPSESCSAFNRLVQLLRADVEILNGLSWRRIAYTLLVGAGLALFSAFGNWMRARYGWHPKPVGINHFFLHRDWGWLPNCMFVLPMLFSQMFALTVADNLRFSGVSRTVSLLVAFILGTAAGSFGVVTGGYSDRPAAWGLVWGGLVWLVYFKRRRDMELAAALHASQMARVELQKKALESQLQVMQAHVEPQFLFNTLRRVGGLYETDPSSADRVLENLIVYLRAALPQMRTNSSTLGREVELARAYLEIERTCRDDRLDFAFVIPERLASATFPPMLVLPLIESLTEGGHNGLDYDGALRAEARANHGMLEIVLTHTGGRGRPACAEFEEINGRLNALYGADAKLQVDMLEPRGTIARLSVPYAAA